MVLGVVKSAGNENWSSRKVDMEGWRCGELKMESKTSTVLSLGTYGELKIGIEKCGDRQSFSK